MHIKAIQIKEQLLGHEDYEVALSVGHLASLYNYDMNQYEDAERLYLRSIAIGKEALLLFYLELHLSFRLVFISIFSLLNLALYPSSLLSLADLTGARLVKNCQINH